MEDSYLNKIPVISIVSTKSDTGKTTLIENIIKILKNKKYKVGAIKHDVHKFEIDYPGKDSYKLTEAGADKVVVSSDSKLAMIQRIETKRTIDELLWLFKDMDIIIIEGFKDNNFPKIEIHRKEVDSNLLCQNPKFDSSSFIAVASNEPLNINIPVLDINNPEEVCDFIERNILGGSVVD
jgi:molybdopterin-guanine dinucleotide biosynthesis protein B